MRSIPARLLADSAVITVCSGLDQWQRVGEKQTVKVSRVHLQAVDEIKKTKENTEVILLAVLFIDRQLSRMTPALPYSLEQLYALSLKNGAPMRVTVYNAAGAALGDFEVISVDAVPDVPSTRTHHWELGLV